jgi:hypothetical protein
MVCINILSRFNFKLGGYHRTMVAPRKFMDEAHSSGLLLLIVDLNYFTFVGQQYANVPSVLSIPPTPSMIDLPVPQLQNIVSTVNLGLC